MTEPEAGAAIGPHSKERFINRELSWLAFNNRVIEEAFNPSHPLLERVRFLSISASNLDEFTMVRVAGLKGQIENGVRAQSQDGLSPAQQLAALDHERDGILEAQKRCWIELEAELGVQGIAVIEAKEVLTSERRWLEDRFMQHVFPVLTPLAIDPAHAAACNNLANILREQGRFAEAMAMFQSASPSQPTQPIAPV